MGAGAGPASGRRRVRAQASQGKNCEGPRARLHGWDFGDGAPRILDWTRALPETQDHLFSAPGKTHPVTVYMSVPRLVNGPRADARRTHLAAREPN